MARSLNKVQLIGNMTRDPELRYTPQGTAVCTFGLATNRVWLTDDGEKHEEAEFHRIVAWNKLAELCAQLLFKGRKVYIEGRLQTRQWTGQDGMQRKTTEIVASDMIILDSRREAGTVRAETTETGAEEAETAEEVVEKETKAVSAETEEKVAEEIVGEAPVLAGPVNDQKPDNQKKRKKKKEEKARTEEEKGKEEIPF